MRRWLERLPMWQYAVLQYCSAILAIAIAAAVIKLIHHRISIRWFAEYGAFYAIFFTGFSTLARHRRLRRREE